jgi:GT2 family glycosyltransferase
MSDHPQADVVVPVYRDTAMTIQCLESVLAHDEETLRALIVVEDNSPEPDMRAALETLSSRDARVGLIHNDVNLGFVGSCNRGLAARWGDAVLLNSDTIVTPGWLRELAEVASLDERTSCVSPLSNHASICSVPEFNEETPSRRVASETVRSACAGLPRWTEIPTGVGFCLYLPSRVLDLVGPLDLAFAPGYNEENDWAMRAQAMGFVARRANHAFVYHLGSRSFQQKTLELEQRNAGLLCARHPQYAPQVARFYFTLDSRIAAHAVRVESAGQLRVAIDLRRAITHQVSTSYAHALARSLSEIPEVQLTLVVRRPEQAAGVAARVVVEEDRLYDVEIIHGPDPIIDPNDLRLLFDSPAHTILSHMDLTAYREPAVSMQDEADRFWRACTLAVQACQMNLAASAAVRGDLISRFGLPPEEVVLIPPGADGTGPLLYGEEDGEAPPRAAPSPRFFLTLVSDSPRSNLANLITAYDIFRHRWTRPGESPGLVVVGEACRKTHVTGGDPSPSSRADIRFLGTVGEAEFRRLRRAAVAFVYPAVDEGCGLPILESMDAGTPVLALRRSAVPEVGGDAILYADGTSPRQLAEAMDRLATDSQLREELRHRGIERVARFRWERTARMTVAAYRTAVFRPSERSMRARRQLVDLVAAWVAAASIPGIRNACMDLNRAVKLRMRRELDRLRARPGRRSA